MIVVRLKGGLGNQMFQYAYGRALSIERKEELCFNLEYFSNTTWTPREYQLGDFNVKAEISKNEIPFFVRYISPLLKKIKIGRNIYLDGYFQSEKYFKKYESQIRQDFTLKKSISEKAKIFLEEIKNSNSICVHIRRGDYVNNKFHTLQAVDYYKSGIVEIEKKSNVDKVFVFSDDISWCKENIDLNHEMVFVDGVSDIESMHLMSNCKNFIIANSSFSWWGAWLGSTSSSVVVAPKRWFNNSIEPKDLIPKEWIRM